MNARMPVFDVVKALMMIWVIWGHLALYHVVDAAPNVLLHNAKIGVNMPIFFVISGYFAASTFRRLAWSKVMARSVLFLWPQIVFAVFYGILLFVLTGRGRGAFYAVLDFWFVRAFAVVYILCGAIYMAFKSDRLRWLIFIFLYAVWVLCPAVQLSYWPTQAIHMFPYFVFGLMVLGKHEYFKDSCISLLCGAFFVAVVVLEGDSTVNGMNFWYVHFDWRNLMTGSHVWLTLLGRTAIGIAGSIFVLFAVDQIVQKVPRLAFFAPLGTTSMGVYVMHEFPLLFYSWNAPPPLFPAEAHLFVAIGYFMVCHYIISGLKRIHVLKLLIFGDEEFLASRMSVAVEKFDKKLKEK